MNQEVMKLYQENGANPLAGCLPLVVQLPVFFALFNVLRAIAEGKTVYGLTPAVVYSARHADILSATIADRIVTSPLPPWHLAPGPTSAKIVIGITVLISATTTFLTVRQSVKRGIGQVGQDPNNPMANSQKYMMYIAPLFALSGLYWQFGLVLYWVTTNVWTLGQQFILFRNFTPITAAADAESATAPAAKGTSGPAGTTVSKGAAAKSQARGSASKTGSAPKTAAGKVTTTKSAPAGKSAGTSAAKSAAAKNPGSRDTAAAPSAARAPAKSSAGTTAKGTSENPVPAAAVKSTGKGGDGQRPRSAQPRTAGSTAAATGPQAAKNSDSAPNGTERRGLAKLVRGKSEPEPEPEVPAARLVRQQPVRQSRSKRSGKR